MADIRFNQVRYRIGLGYNWTTATVRAAVLLKDTWTPNVDDDFVSTATIAGADIRGSRTDLIGKSVALDDTNDRAVWSCSNIVVAGVTLGQTYDSFLIYNFVSSDADSWLIALFDVGLHTAAGGSVVAAVNASGLIPW